MLINNITHQRENLTEWPIWLPLNILLTALEMGSGNSHQDDNTSPNELGSLMKELDRDQIQRLGQAVGDGRYGTVYFGQATGIIEGELTDVAVKKLGMIM